MMESPREEREGNAFDASPTAVATQGADSSAAPAEPASVNGAGTTANGTTSEEAAPRKTTRRTTKAAGTATPRATTPRRTRAKKDDAAAATESTPAETSAPAAEAAAQPVALAQPLAPAQPVAEAPRLPAMLPGEPAPVIHASREETRAATPDFPRREEREYSNAPSEGSPADTPQSTPVSSEQADGTQSTEPRSENQVENRSEMRGFEARGDNRNEARDGAPRDNAPRDNAPRDNTPRENSPRDNMPRDDRNGRGGLRFRGREGRTEFGPREFRNREEREPREATQGNREPNSPREPRDNSRDNGRGRFRDREPREPRGDRDFDRTFGRGGRIEHDFHSLEAKSPEELLQLATEMQVEFSLDTPQKEVIHRILEAQAIAAGNLLKKGILEILPDGKGFMRCDGYLPSTEDVYVSPSQIKKFNLKTGDMVSGQVRAPKEMERYYGLLRVEACNGEAPDINRQRKDFEKLTPIYPDDKIELETTQENITARIIDLVSPIGMGQRGLIVAPPKAGKTSLIKNVANSIMANHPGVYLIVLLIDERPEEVTDISRSIKGEVVASTFDELPENHIRVADMVLEKAKRMVEQKRDVVILLDSITRLSRASNLVVTPSGRTMSGGLDPAAMHKPKRLFGAARNIEEGGSLTILATVLVDTGSRMDEYIFEELKGTGNMDLVLDRNLFDQRIFPAIDINRSGTRRDDLLLSKDDLAAVFHLRKTLAQLDNDKAITLLIDRLKNTKTNADFMQVVQKSARQSGNANGGPPPVP
jgi:transcription termination factor Rho